VQSGDDQLDRVASCPSVQHPLDVEIPAVDDRIDVFRGRSQRWMPEFRGSDQNLVSLVAG